MAQIKCRRSTLALSEACLAPDMLGLHAAPPRRASEVVVTRNWVNKAVAPFQSFPLQNRNTTTEWRVPAGSWE